MNTQWFGEIQAVNRAIKHSFLILVTVIAGWLITLHTAQCKEANDLVDRKIILDVLLTSQVLNKDRQLVHLSHVCNLQIDGKNFPVVDVRELIVGATTPRGVNRIIVLTDHLVPVQMIDYTTQRPLFCKDQRLFVFGDLMIDNVLPEGNILSFTNNGQAVDVQLIDFNELPIPTTGTEKFKLQ